MASGPITSWKIDGETVETVSDFIFLGSKITADGDCSHEIKGAYSLDTIERQFQNAVTYHTGAAISLVMMILIFISLAVMNKFSDGGEDIIV